MVKLFCIWVRNELEQRVKGRVYIEYNKEEDTIIVTIHSYLKSYRYTFTNISIRIWEGVNSSDIANEVLKGYKHYVLKYFFK